MDAERGIAGIEDLAIEGRRVFVRVDFNVPLALDGTVADDARIREALPTILHARERHARIVLASHLGRPKGRDLKLSLEPVALRLAELIGDEVVLPDDCIGDGARKVVLDLREGQVALLENLRFHREEEADDEAFARELAREIDVYVNDAFGAAHRAHASVHAIARVVPERGAGLLLRKEFGALGRLRGDVERPYVAVLGGAKVSDKLGVLAALVDRVDALVVGGAMANTFLGARGVAMGRSLREEGRYPHALDVLRRAGARGVPVLLPTDVVVASDRKKAGEGVSIADVPEGSAALDIGPETSRAFREKIVRAKTVFWNGPMGLCEEPAFAEGTKAVARAVADVVGFTVAGGGDSVAAIRALGPDLSRRISHLSTGGGASLEFIEGRKLPGVEALR